MSKKKIQHKGKPKHSTEQSEDFTSFNTKENVEEEYNTVLDFETNKKYNKRLLQNNWAKYEAPLTDFECRPEEEEPKTDDFTFLLKTASSDCSHFQFNSEKLWKSDNSVPPSEIFNLDLNILSKGLACVPFYERIGLDESELSKEEKDRCDKAAADSRKDYNLFLQKSSKKGESENEKPSQKNTLEELFQVKVENSNKGSKSTEGDICETETKKKLFFSENDENLEDWLDSVLDD